MDILPKQNMDEISIERAGDFFSDLVQEKYSSSGKWPSKYQLSFYQQLAVNLERKYFEEDHKTIMSVNGPPGTGKTTLLKDIIAGKIVDRADVLSERNCLPDEWFEEKKLKIPFSKYIRSVGIPDSRITGYEILVVSSNNSAVENISKELPSVNGLKSGLSDEMDDVRQFFTPQKDKDIYFTEYAKVLAPKEDDYWGLISVPLGKRENLNRFFREVLTGYRARLPKETNNFLYRSRNDISSYAEKYQKTRLKYLAQKKKVDRLRLALYKEEKEPEKPNVEVLKQNIGTLKEKLRDIERAFILEDLTNPDLILDRLYERKEEIKENIEKLNLENSHPDKGLFGKFKSLRSSSDNEQEKKELATDLKRIQYQIDQLVDYSILKRDLDKKQNELYKIEESYNQEYLRWKEGKETSFESETFFPGFKTAQILSEEGDQARKIQLKDPGISYQYDRERERLFMLALELHRDFVLGSKFMRDNPHMLGCLYGFGGENEDISLEDNTQEIRTALLQSLFLMVPVISSTFASIGYFLGKFTDPETIGLLLIDEAGQATPQSSVGVLERSRHTVIVGDPKQIEPVVTGDFDIILQQIYDPQKYGVYLRQEESVQTFADSMNPHGTFLDSDKSDWIGIPLLIHRRCLSPMFDISNQISYNGIMLNETISSNDELPRSKWYDVKGKKERGNKDHSVKEQEDKAIELIADIRSKTDREIYVISPFTSVVNSFTKKAISCFGNLESVKLRVGTVHTFQGKEADIVIFILGCDQNAKGAVQWVSKNIVNVAATRAKKHFYVIGDKSLWKQNRFINMMIRILDDELPK